MKNNLHTILITGSTGTIGSRLIEFFIAQQRFHIIAITRDNTKTSKIKNLEYIYISKNLKFDYTEVCKKIDSIIHLASTNSKYSFENPFDAFQVNCIETGKLYEAALKSNVSKFIYFSTAHIYGEFKGDIDELTCSNCKHAYATSHRSAEDLIIALSKSNQIDTIIIRLSNSFGVTNSINSEDLLINDLTKQAARENNLHLKSKINLTRNFITLTDVCRATLHFINLSSTSKIEIYNLGGEKSFTLYEIAQFIKKRSDIKFLQNSKIVYPEGFNINESHLFNYNISKIKNSGFRLISNFEEEIDLLLDNYKEFE